MHYSSFSFHFRRNLNWIELGYDEPRLRRTNHAKQKCQL